MEEPRSIADLKKEEIDSLKSIIASSGWSVFVSVLLGLKEKYQSELEDLERNIMEGNNAQKVGVIRKVLDYCNTVIGIPEELATEKPSDIEKELEVY